MTRNVSSFCETTHYGAILICSIQLWVGHNKKHLQLLNTAATQNPEHKYKYNQQNGHKQLNALSKKPRGTSETVPSKSLEKNTNLQFNGSGSIPVEAPMADASHARAHLSNQSTKGSVLIMWVQRVHRYVSSKSPNLRRHHLDVNFCLHICPHGDACAKQSKTIHPQFCDIV